MAKIHISRDRQSLGHFHPDEVVVGLRTGRFVPSDLGWQDPMETWKPLSEFEDLPDVEPEVVEAPPLPDVEKPAASEKKAGVPAWEKRGELSVRAALLQTISQVFSSPTKTFRGLAAGEPTSSAMRYYLLLSIVGTWVFMSYQLILALLFPDLVLEQMGGKITMAMFVQGQIFSMLIAPLFLAGLAYLVAGALHLLLTVLGGAQPDFGITFRVFCYAVGTSFVFLLVPMCGLLFFGVSAMVFLVLGLKEAHATDAVRPLVAVLIPAILLVLGYGLMVVSLMQSGMLK